MAGDNGRGFYLQHEQLLRLLAEQLKLPLLQIAQSVELARWGEAVNLERVESVAEAALNLVDGYVLGIQLATGQLGLNFEPVSVASVLYNSADKLKRIAREYNCAIEVDLGGRYGPVMADRGSLEVAMAALGYAFIESQTRHGSGQSRLVLAAHRGRLGLVAGAYGEHGELTAATLHRAKRIAGRARQPLPLLGHGSCAGIFVADTLLNAMSSGLRVARRHNLTGLAAVLQPSAQLTLI